MTPRKPRGKSTFSSELVYFLQSMKELKIELLITPDKRQNSRQIFIPYQSKHIESCSVDR